MFLSSSIWSIINPLRNWKLEGLSKKEIELLIVSFSDLERSTCRIFKKGDKDWKPISDFSELDFSRSFENKIDCPPLPENVALRKNPHEGEEDTTQVLIRSNSALPREPERHYDRYPLEVTVRVVMGNKNFETNTEKLSLGGIRLKEPLPAWVAGYYPVFLALPDQTELELVCSVAEDQNVQDRHRMEIADVPKTIQYKVWFQDYFSGQEPL
ncbi:MAG: PilZ domain-containing protein [Pseudobdellovibrionaceae bacterium]